MEQRTPPDGKRRHYWTPIRIVIVYGIFSIAWILFSDLAVNTLIEDPVTRMNVSIVKGWGFVLATSFILYILITRGQLSIRRSLDSLKETEAKYSAASKERSIYHKRSASLEQRLQALLNRLDVGVFQLSRDGRVLDANPAFLRILGADSMDDVTGLDMLSAILPESAALSIRDELQATGKITESEVQLRTIGGTWITCSMTGGMVPDGTGEEVIEGLIEDITERKRAEAELARMNDTLEAVIDASPVAIIDFDQNKTVRTWNRAAERMFALPKEEVVGKPFFAQERGRAGYLMLIEALVEGQRVVDQEAELAWKDGATLQVSLSAAPLHDAKGRVSGAVAVMLDISGRKEAERERRQAYEQISRNIEQFAVLVDSIRNPLTVIVGIADMNDGDGMRQIADQAQRIEDIIKQLDAGWIESEKVRDVLRKGG